MLKLFVPFCLLLALASCVPNRKYQYLQKEDVNADFNGLPKDSVVRTYTIEDFDYKVQPNDIISVRFESLTDEEFDFLARFNQQVGGAGFQGNFLLLGELVNPDGTVHFPAIGSVKVAGKTVFEIQEELRVLAARFVKDPVVRVRLLNYRVTLLGEVKAEGTITLSNNRVSVPEAIGLAGGLGELADRSNVKVIRQYGNRSEVYYINLLDENFMNSPNFYVHQNDIIVVPPLRQRPFRRYFNENLALFVSAVSVILLAINLIQN